MVEGEVEYDTEEDRYDEHPGISHNDHSEQVEQQYVFELAVSVGPEDVENIENGQRRIVQCEIEALDLRLFLVIACDEVYACELQVVQQALEQRQVQAEPEESFLGLERDALENEIDLGQQGDPYDLKGRQERFRTGQERDDELEDIEQQIAVEHDAEPVFRRP